MLQRGAIKLVEPKEVALIVLFVANVVVFVVVMIGRHSKIDLRFSKAFLLAIFPIAQKLLLPKFC